MRNLSILATAIVISLSTFSCSEQKTADEYLISAQQFIEDNKNSAAIVELKNAVKLAPKNAEIRRQLGKAYILQGNYINAEKELERALKLGVSDLIPDLALVKSKLNKTKEVYQYVTDGSGLPDEQYILVLVYAGISALQNGEIELAQDYFGQTISIDADNEISQLAKAYISHTKLEFDKALTEINDMLGSAPENTEAILLKANILFAKQEYKSAAESFESYNKIRPEDYYVKFYEVNSLIKAAAFEEAEQQVDKLLKIIKNSPIVFQYKAEIEYHKDNFIEAKRYAELSNQQGQQVLVAKLIAGVSSYRLGDMEQAYFYLRPLERHFSDDHPAKKILILVKLNLGYAEEALSSINEINKMTVDDIQFLSGASLRMAQVGDSQSAMSLIEQAEKISPKNSTIKARKGLLLLSQKDDEGIKSLETALKLNPNLGDVESVLAMEYLANNQDAKVQDIIDNKLSSPEQKVSGLIIQGIYLSKKGQLQSAIENFQKVLEIESDNVAALYNLGLFAIKEGNIDSALSYFKRVIDVDANHRMALKNYSDIQISKNKTNVAIEYLETKVDMAQPTSNIDYALVFLYRKEGQADKAAKLLSRVVNENATSEYGYLISGDTFMQAGDYQSALAAFSKGAKQFPENYNLAMRYAGILEIMRNFKEALRVTKTAYKTFKGDAKIEILLAQYEIANRNYAEGKRYVKILRDKKVSHMLLDVSEGNIAVHEKNYDKAIELFNTAYEVKANRRNLLLLARALVFNKQTKEAVKSIEQFLIRNPTDSVSRYLLADLYGRIDKNKAVAEYEKLLKLFPEDVRILNNLAWYNYEKDQLPTALKYIESAYQLNSEKLEILETYGVILDSMKEKGLALEILEKAYQRNSQDAPAMITLAQLYIEKDLKDDAIKVLSTITTNNAEHLRKIDALKSKAN